ncbi:MAG: energy-coupling factor transporter transmembrane component T [Lachnospiraceae bacterium]
MTQRPAGESIERTLTDELYETPGIDCRVRMAAIVLGTIGAFFVRSELLLGLTALLGLVWLCVYKQVRAAIGFVCLYLVLSGISHLPLTGAAGSLLFMATILRRMLLPAFFAIPLGKAPTGTLLTTLHRLHLPRTATIALAIVFRFMPTVTTEYQSIRVSQKFRGIGVTVWGLLRHPVQSVESILIPLLLRTTRIADELAASAMLRGADQQQDVTSFRPIHFTRKDTCLLLVIILLSVGLILADLFLKE